MRFHKGGLHSDNLRSRHHSVIMGNRRDTVKKASKLGLSLDKDGLKTLISNLEGSAHPCHSPADHQTICLNRQPDFFTFLEKDGFGHTHFDEILCLLGRPLRFSHVDPGILLPDTHEFKEIGV